MAMNKQRRTSNINNIVTYDTIGNVTLPADLTVEGLQQAGFVKTDAAGLFSVDAAAYITLSSTLTGYSVGAATAISSSDTLLQAFGKLQGQLDAIPDSGLITGSGAAGQVTYWTATAAQSGSNNLFWDNTNGRLGIGTTAPASSLHVLSTATIPARFISSGTTTQVILDNTNANLWGSNIDVRVNGNTQFNFGTLGSLLGNTTYDATIYARAGNGFRVNVNNSATTSFFVNSAGNTLINSTSDSGQRLQVTGDGYFSGSVGIGTSTLTSANLTVAKTIATDGSYGIYQLGQIQTAVTGNGGGFINALVTIASTNLTNYYHYRAIEGTIGASTTIANNYGYHIADMATGTNRYGYFGNVSSGTGKWNLYMNGTAANYLNGSLSIGTTTSNAKLQIQSTSNVEWTDTAILNGGANGDNSGTRIYIRPATNFGAAIYGGRWSSTDRGARLVGISSGGAENSFIHLNGESSIITLGTATSVRATLDASGNLGLGVTPSTWSVGRGFDIATGLGLLGYLNQSYYLNNAYFNGNWTYKATAPASMYLQDNGGNHTWHNQVSGTAGTTFNFTERMRLDASGNLGLGITPSAWAVLRGFQVGLTASVSGYISGTEGAFFSSNQFYDGGAFKYIVNGFSTQYLQINGQHIWSTAASGIAGASITSTQVARITSGGNFIINNASTDNGLRFQVTGDGFFSGGVGIGQTTFSGSNFRISKTLTGSASAINFYIDSVIQSDVTNSPKIIATTLSTQAAAFTIPIVSHFYANQGSIGAGSAITTQIGFQADNTLTGATNNFGFYGNIPSGTGRWNLYMNGTANNYLAGSLGIGITTPTYLIDAYGTTSSRIRIQGTTNFTLFQSQNNGGIFYIGTDSSTASGFGAGNYSRVVWSEGAYPIVFATNNTERMRLDASGNLGLGVTPSAWSGLRALQVGATASLAGFTPSGDGAYLSSNAFFNGTSWIYQTTATSSQYVQISGQHRWFSASSGTAGNSITFTESMRLDASGNLLLGDTASTGERLQVTGNGKLTANGANVSLQLIRAGAGGGTTTMQQVDSGEFYLSSTTRMYINTNGANRFLINNTGNVSIGTSPTDAGYKLDVNGTMRVTSRVDIQGSASGLSLALPNGSWFGASSTNRMAFDGINQLFHTGGASGSYKFRNAGDTADVFTLSNTGAATFNNTVTFNGSTTFNAGAVIRSDNGTAAAPSISFDSDLDTGIYRIAANTLGFTTTGTERMRLDASGNLGLGVTPSAWHSNLSVAQLGLNASISQRKSGAGFYIGNNYYFPSDPEISGLNTAIALYTGGVALYNQAASVHRWYQASGTAGNAITFTQAMTLDASGNLAVGTTTTTNRLEVWGSGNTAARIVGQSAGNATLILSSGGVTAYSIKSGNGDSSLRIDQDGTERIMLASGGNLLIGTTTNSTFKLDVNGTMRVSGASTITNATLPSLKINHTASGHASAWFDTNEFGLLISSASTSASHYLVNMTSNSVSRFRVGCDGAATFSGSLTVNTNTLFADASNNRVGIGTASPAEALDVVGAIKTAGGGHLGYFTGSSAIFTNAVGYGSATGFSITYVSESGLTFGLDSSQLLILDGSGGMSIPYSGGLKIGTLTSQKVGFWNATPIVQPTTSVAGATRTGGGGNTVTDSDTFDGYTIGQVVKALRNTGLLA